MEFRPTPLAGAFLVLPERHEDHRGFFARTFCREEFAEHGLATTFAQCNISYNQAKGTLRGMHFQKAPFGEAKLVRCTSGGILDVIVDVRRGSPTHLMYYSAELTADNRAALYVPKGFAHGFLTLAPETEVFYQMSDPFVPGHDRGLRWNDPAIGISWPFEPSVILERDANYPDYSPEADYVG